MPGNLAAHREVAKAGRALLMGLCVLAGPVLAQFPDASRQRELVRLVRQDCGSCHGMTLKGGLGPPLTPGALDGKPLDSMVATVMNGRPGTPMPPWSRFVTEGEAQWIVEQLMRGFPAE
jgi:cytochrome c55X